MILKKNPEYDQGSVSGAYDGVNKAMDLKTNLNLMAARQKRKLI